MRFLRPLFLGLLVSLLPIGPALGQGSFPFGDLNCDESVNVTDVQLSILSALGLPISATLDANEDGTPDACESNCTGLACGPGTLPNGEGTACVVDPAVLNDAFEDGAASVDITVDNDASYTAGMEALCVDAGGLWVEGTCQLTACLNGGTCNCAGTGFEGPTCAIPKVPCTEVSCDDGEACTEDNCADAYTCVHTPNNSLCDDGNPCTENTCDSGQGCLLSNASENTACDDGEACTDDICIDGTCVSSPTPDVDGIPLVEAAVNGNGQVVALLQDMLHAAEYATCGTRSDMDRAHLQAEMERLLDGLDRVATLTSYANTPLLSGDGDGGPLELNLENTLVNGTVWVNAATAEDLFGESLPALDSWANAVQAHGVLVDALDQVEATQEQLENGLEVLTDACGDPFFDPTQCHGLHVNPVPPGCAGAANPEICLLELLDTADAGLDTLEPILGDLVEAAMSSVCGTLNPSEQATVNALFETHLTVLEQTIDAVEFEGSALLQDGLTLPVDLTNMDGETEAASPIQLPALGNGGLFPLGTPSLTDLAAAQMALSALQNAYDAIAGYRQDIRAQRTTYTDVFGCAVAFPPADLGPPPTSRPDLLAECEACADHATQLFDVAIGGYEQIITCLLEMKSLALSNANPATPPSQLDALDDLFQDQMDLLNDTATNTSFNGTYVLGGGSLFEGPMIVFQSGTQNTIHNMLMHYFPSQSSTALFGFSPPSIDTVQGAQQAVGAVNSALFALETDQSALVSKATLISMRKESCSLYIPHDVTGPGEVCSAQGLDEECEDCALQHCALLETAKKANEDLMEVLVKMNALAITATDPDLDLYDLSYLDTEFQDLLAHIDTLSNVTQYNGLYPMLGDGGGGDLVLSTLSGPNTLEVSLSPTEIQDLLEGQFPGLFMQSFAIDAVTITEIGMANLTGNLTQVEAGEILFGCTP